uniref:Carboxylic ester hydrolase n=1 Tax=Sparus aurata TaxID=8175 RepID=A0A671U3Z5_SPAAU
MSYNWMAMSHYESASLPEAPEVHTKLGSLRGTFVSVKGKEAGVHAFLGVPFAKPPVGPALRLAAPQPVEGWKGRNFLWCHGFTQNPYWLFYSEPFHFLLVMVWIHGGGFAMGSASMYDGSALAAYQDMVVVLIQYRLGHLGFLSTGDEHMSGNFGLLDQVQALRWVQEHIHNFGGNPDLVTIFGESAGGVSVSLLLLSPLSNGLCQRAIAESGTAAMDLLMTNNPLPTTQVGYQCIELMGRYVIIFMLFFFSNFSLYTFCSLKDVQLSYPVNGDGYFLTKPVDELFQKHELLTVPFMTGVNDDEGGWLLAGVSVALFLKPIINGLVVEEYIGNGEDRVKNRDGFREVVGDLMFNIPAIKTANAHRDAGAPVYLYEYQYPPKFMQKKRPSFVGCDHGDEIMTVLGICFTNSHIKLNECSEEEMQLSKTMMSYWANFARTGSPNGNGLSHWPKYGAEEHYLEIRLKEQVTGQSLKKDRFLFMTQTLPEKVQQHKSPEVHTKLGSLRGTFFLSDNSLCFFCCSLFDCYELHQN